MFVHPHPRPPLLASGHHNNNFYNFINFFCSYAVGLGNVWRFPYLAQKNGGGAFLVPYFIMLCIQGIPIFYLELAIGQRLRKGAIGVWSQVSPYLGGIGISSAVVSYIVALYYNTIIAWCLIYLLHSFESPLPWAECPTRLYANYTYDHEPECVVSTLKIIICLYRENIYCTNFMSEKHLFDETWVHGIIMTHQDTPLVLTTLKLCTLRKYVH